MKLKVILTLGFMGLSTQSFSWGERGHVVVTDVAVELIRAHQGGDSAFAKLLTDKRSQLAHLSNIPDILWRNQDRTIAALNAPTHYIDLDYLGNITPETAPRNIKSLRNLVSELCKTPPQGYKCPIEKNQSDKSIEDVVGTAPLRIGQLYQKIVDQLKLAHTAQAESEKKKAVDQSLIYLGLISHFIGDLANPMHTTRDYDGWEMKRGGLHSYFETEIVNAWNISLTSDVMSKALKKGRLKNFAKEQKFDPITNAYQFSFESNKLLTKLFAWDKTDALRNVSSDERGMKIKAVRKDPDQVIKSGATRELIADRLSSGAHELASVWVKAWQEASSPNFKDYKSFEYPFTPEFVLPISD